MKKIILLVLISAIHSITIIATDNDNTSKKQAEEQLQQIEVQWIEEWAPLTFEYFQKVFYRSFYDCSQYFSDNFNYKDCLEYATIKACMAGDSESCFIFADNRVAWEDRTRKKIIKMQNKNSSLCFNSAFRKDPELYAKRKMQWFAKGDKTIKKRANYMIFSLDKLSKIKTKKGEDSRGLKSRGFEL